MRDASVPSPRRTERRFGRSHESPIDFLGEDLDKRIGNKMATTLAVSTQCVYNVNGCVLNCKGMQFKVLQRQHSVNAM